MKKPRLNPCPFCGGAASIGICDDEGNPRDPDYQDDPWSGLAFRIRHTVEDNPGCPIAAFEEDGGSVGVFLYDSPAEAAREWNRRTVHGRKRIEMGRPACRKEAAR